MIRSRFCSTTVEPAVWAPMPPPNMSERPPPFPLCRRTRKMRPRPEEAWMIATNTNMVTAGYRWTSAQPTSL